ncbi:MAG: glycosyltransferase family 2 protein [Methylococcales bacterium]
MAVVSAIIVNYNAGELLQLCVQSLLNSSLAIEIIIVDNASSDHSIAALADIAGLKIIQNPTNIGFAAACNIGLKSAQADKLLFLNPDCSMQANAIEELVKELCANEKTGMVGGLLVNPDGSEQGGGRRAIPTPWRSFVRVLGLNKYADRWPRLFFDFYLHNNPLPDHAVEVEAISGACMLVKRAAIDNVGAWDEGYFLHCEDLDWCMRFRQKGWKIMFVPTAQIRHALGVCGRARPVFVEWHKHKGMGRFYCKFFRHQYPGILMGMVMVAVWIRFSFIALYYTGNRLCKRLGFHLD